jgi:hypothetical protein
VAKEDDTLWHIELNRRGQNKPSQGRSGFSQQQVWERANGRPVDPRRTLVRPIMESAFTFSTIIEEPFPANVMDYDS